MGAATFSPISVGSLSSYSLAFAVDHGVAPWTTAFVLGRVMFLPAAAWGLALRLWRKELVANLGNKSLDSHLIS